MPVGYVGVGNNNNSNNNNVGGSSLKGTSLMAGNSNIAYDHTQLVVKNKVKSTAIMCK